MNGGYTIGGNVDYADYRGECFVQLNEVTHAIIDATMKVHRALGPGLLESAYEAQHANELKLVV